MESIFLYPFAHLYILFEEVFIHLFSFPNKAFVVGGGGYLVKFLKVIYMSWILAIFSDE